VRLFVALDLPGEVREALTALIAGLKPKSRDARWVEPRNLHVTLKFIGFIDASKLQPIQDALARVHSPQPIVLNFHDLGFFPNERRPRVFWCGVEGSSNLAALAADIDSALAPLGIESEKRAYIPHLTLARLKTDTGADALVRAAESMKARDFGPARETHFHLYESLLKPTGAQYNRLTSFPILSGSAAKAG